MCVAWDIYSVIDRCVLAPWLLMTCLCMYMYVLALMHICMCVSKRNPIMGQSSRSQPPCQLSVRLWKVWFAVLILRNAIQQFPCAQQGEDKLIKEIENQFGSPTVISDHLAKLFLPTRRDADANGRAPPEMPIAGLAA